MDRMLRMDSRPNYAVGGDCEHPDAKDDDLMCGISVMVLKVKPSMATR